MDHRTDSFFRRFTSAQSHLKVQDIQGLVSLKYRDDCLHNPEYSGFIDDLRRASHLPVKQVHGEFGGRAWLVRDKSQNSAILVEHETGLEILGAIGAIASLIALLPLISSGWTKLRGGFSHPHFDHPSGGVEIRRFDQRNVLIEEQTPSVEAYVLNITLQDYALSRQKVQQLEAEIDNLKKKHLPKKKSQALRSRRKTKRPT